MIAGRGGDDRRQPWGALGQSEQGVAGAAPLEGAGQLQRLELQEDVTSGCLREALGANQRRAADVRRNAARCRLNVSK